MNKNIDATIVALIEIGENYPKTKSGLAGFFSKHQNQSLASLLKTLRNLSPDEVKLQAVQQIVSEIYHTVMRPGMLVKSIHACLCESNDFSTYKINCETLINNHNDNTLKSEGYDIKLTMNMSDYRKAFGCFHHKTAQSEEYRS